uniref:BTB domain-containing protein n=1 Tax=Panagrolaimus superbus TaxID=310955 RepID=A0A914XVV9_9BILA
MSEHQQEEQYPLSLRWKISREDVENYKYLETKEFISNSFVSYSVQLRVAETELDERGHVAIYLYVNPKNTAGVTAKVSISFPNLHKVYQAEHFFDDAHGWGLPFCRSDFFLDENSPAFVDGNFVVEIKGILFIASNFWNFRLSRNDIGSNILEHGEKDFTLLIKGKELKVHKLVLTSCSHVFADMVEVVNMKKEENNILDIGDDFDYETVEAAIMYCYQENRYINDKNITEVCKFADKFEIKGFKNKIVEYMNVNISNMNVCQFINAANYLQASKLEKKCMEFLRKCVNKQNAVYINDLYPELAKKFIDFICCTDVQTYATC